MKADIQEFLLHHDVKIVRFVCMEGFDRVKSKGYKWAIWFAKPMSKDYIKRFNNFQCKSKEEFNELEKETDKIADLLAEFIEKRGYSACSQSEESNIANGSYTEDTLTSILPHKTIAVLSGIGWIGKNALLVTKDYGCALSTCSVLTNAPIDISSEKIQIHYNLCGDCTICQGFCNCLTGKNWDITLSREDIINVYDCERCLKCLMFCPWTKQCLEK
ncbi:hypothetical protein [Ruminiclostridium josui]|uniref:hypothetical protein n=1 Tax=Ruminiclostridium josui TaxID=1499 RepID=UPI0004660EFD|nr:hypothetical protein [Ruminiclostridium josui]